jgi:hypothetical protein
MPNYLKTKPKTNKMLKNTFKNNYDYLLTKDRKSTFIITNIYIVNYPKNLILYYFY